MHETLGALLSQSGRPIEAEHHHRAALPRLKDKARCLSNLAVALQMQARHAETEQCYREALALRPDYPSGHGNLLFALNYRDDLTRRGDLRRISALGRAARPARWRRPIRTSRWIARPGAELRLGYVSPDFRQHAAALFAEPLLAAHDRSQVELFCYAEVPIEDATTARFRALADHWRPTSGRSDDDMAAMIRQDRIDVLIDLAGHTAANRLLVFARKPAPVQIEYILGHGYTSGMSAMDGFLADDTLAPPGADALFSERLIRLPRIPLAYRPPEGMPPVATTRRPPRTAMSPSAISAGRSG